MSKSLGMSADEIAEGNMRVAPAAYCNAEHAPGAWILEWVATKPEFRRRGYIEQLIEHTLERGRARGAVVAEVGVLIGNDPAQAAYEKAGFAVVQEVRHPEFEAAFHAPGTRLLRREI